MTRVLLVGAGGFLGSVARYLISGLVQAVDGAIGEGLATLGKATVRFYRPGH